MTDADGNSFRWTIRKIQTYNTNIKRLVNGWSFTDHDGYERTIEGNWFDLVESFRMVANNYGFKTNIS